LNQETTLSTLEFSEEELIDLGDALDNAAKRVADELTLKRSAPYASALKAQQRRYEAMHARVITATENRK
jgi:hypothetical protein